MGIESLIPFGLDTSCNELVDVGSVARGNACGCVCPSCMTPLVARQGEEKEWHFAHRSQKVHNETRKECAYSFAVSVRLMIRQLATAGLKFRTPKFERVLSAYSERTGRHSSFPYTVTDEALLTLHEVQVGAEFSGTPVDVLGYVEGVSFVVYVSYKDRRVPIDLHSPSEIKCGIVELNVDAVPKLFKQEAKGQYTEALRRYIEDDTEGKFWIYHPRETKMKGAALQKMDAWLSQQERAPRSKTSKQLHYSFTLPAAPEASAGSDMRTERDVKNYACVICGSRWTGVSRSCEKCCTHLYTKELD